MDQLSAIEILKELFSMKHFCIEDKIYEVREKEGLGWDGPEVMAFSTWVNKAKRLVDESH